MNVKNKARRGFLLTAIMAVAALRSVLGADVLRENFLNPPDATRPKCYWYWMDGHVTKDGVTKDLEAMKRVGIGEAYIGIIGGQSGLPASPDSPKALTDEWWDNIEHAVREGGRLGVDIGLFNSPGWSQSGGPWVKPNQAMRYVSLPETRLHGPQNFTGKLPTPAGAFQDIAVLAFPAPAGEDEIAPVSNRTTTTVDFAMPAPFTARSVTVLPDAEINVTAELLASDDGAAFRTVTKFPVDRHNLHAGVGPVPLAPVIAAFPATTAKFFRLNFSAPCATAEIRLSPAARVDRFAEKSLIKSFQDPHVPYEFYAWPTKGDSSAPGLAVNPESVLNLTSRLAADGTLRWDMPAGDWIVLRTAMTPTGTSNSPAPPEATGREVDKMNRAALRSHFDAYVGELLKRMPATERTAWKHVVADSYEQGPENWTDGFAGDFKKRYGYDPLPWLPVLTGRVVGDAERSDRFLWDLRRLVADRIARDYVGGLRDLCHECGMKMWLENYGHWGFPAEFLQYGGACDEIAGEFWANGNYLDESDFNYLGRVELRDASSAAHIYGQPAVWAEAFTGGPAFVNTPRDLKARGDWAFCEGINQFVLHVYIHQPWDDRRPGVNAWFGTEFNRNNTWFDYSKPWFDYLRRCSVMLQAGKSVADAAYFITEDAPKMTGLRQPPLPRGYDYDYVNAEVIENRLIVKDGRFVLPDGTSYRLLVLPESKTMRPELLGKIEKLVADGGAVFGSAPERSPSLENFPACDAEVKNLAGELWSGGKIFTGTNFDSAFAKLDLTPDVICPTDVLWKHRRDGAAEIYFLSSQNAKPRTETVSFRVDGKAPELWWPETGRIESEPAFALARGRVEVPVHFEANGSVFVVFRQKATVGRPENFLPPPTVTAIAGPWKLEFPGKKITLKKLASWTSNSNSAIRYYSGAATYRTTFQLSEAATNLVLSLGAVRDIAKVSINGHEIGTVWKEPYALDIGASARVGANDLKITVVNTWHNRLVGDAHLAATNRVTFVSTKSVKANEKLQPAGLLGPVTLLK